MKTELLTPYVLKLEESCFPLGGDSLALGEFATVRPRWRVCDLGCGGGILLLLLARREPTLALAGVELDGAAAACARENLRANGLRGEIVHGDLRALKGRIPNEGFDLVVSNPPYFEVGRGKSSGAARCEEACTLDELCAAANRLLKTGGRFALVHRPQRLADLMCALRARRLEPKRLRFLADSCDREPSALLLEAVKNGGPGLEVLPPLIPRRKEEA